MKAIIYSSLVAAQTALNKCNTIQQGEVENVGEGPFVEPDPSKPYTRVVAHPDGAQWAVVADEKVEAKLKKTATELDESWFPKPTLLSVQKTEEAQNAAG